MTLPPDIAAKILATPGVVVGNAKPTGEREPQSEKDFMAEVVAYAKRNGYMVYHTHNSRRSEPGFPDLVMIRGELLVAAELKRSEKERPTAEQLNWMAAFAGVKRVRSMLWIPDDWPGIVQTLGTN